MAMTNREVSRICERIGHILEIRGESFFKARAYYQAARVIESMGEDINKTVAEGRLGELPGFGEALTTKISQLVRTGRMDYLDEISEGLPEGLLTLLNIPDVGPKKVKLFYDKLGVTDIDSLEKAAREGRIASLPGMGAISEAKILSRIEQYRSHRARRLLSEALPLAEALLAQVSALKEVKRASLAGSVRRRVETIGDIDVLVTADNGPAAVDAFTKLPGVIEVLAAGPTKGSVRFDPGIQSDVRVVEDESFAAALHYFTGSKEHNVHMRQLAKDRGWKLNEYGLFDDDRMLPSKDEAALFKHFGMDWVPPELRENMGEIEAALEHRLPDLVEERDVKGLMHIHSSYSDGRMTVERLAQTIRARGFSYFTLSDHSQSLRVANGLDEERQRQQWRDVDAAREKYPRFAIFRSTEVDIEKDGSLDYEDRLLKEFDCCIAAVHSGFTMSSDDMTARIVKAVSNPYVDILAHPTGRLLLERDPYALDIEKVLKACAEHGVAVEIDGHPSRLDLDWRFAKMGKDLGVKFVVSLDAHREDDFDNLPYGISAARKGWLSKSDILNCLPASGFKKWLSSRRPKKRK